MAREPGASSPSPAWRSSARSGRTDPRTPHDRVRETASDLAGDQLPVPVAVTTRCSIGLDLFASDRDRLLKFPACSALLVGALTGDHGRPLRSPAGIGRIVPGDSGSNIGCIQRPMGRFAGLAAGGLIQRCADFSSDGCAEDRADCGRGGPAVTFAELAADDCAGCSTNEGARGFVLTHPAAASEKYCQGEARAHADGTTANRVCCSEHGVFPPFDELVRTRPPLICLRRSRTAPRSRSLVCWIPVR